MAKPIVHGIGPNLKKGSATSHLWVYGENLRQHDTVEILTPSGKRWTGTINMPPDPPSPPAGTLQKAKIDVKFDASSDTRTDDDFAIITMTVTNTTTGSSVPKFGASIVEGP